MSTSTTLVPPAPTIPRIPPPPAIPVPALPARPIAHPRPHEGRVGAAVRCPACELRDYLEG